jgi:phospholipase C
MKSAKSLLLLLSVLAAAVLSHAQSPKPLHVIVVIQENRTPDNLFQDPTLISNGADIWTVNNPFPCEGVSGGIQVQGQVLNTCFDPDHEHSVGWEETYDNGIMDGACTIPVNESACAPGTAPQYPAVTYVQNLPFGDGTAGILDPYFHIAETYGFANYMFQTNQGPSFPAHQFLFSGTSAPVDYPNQFYDWFAAENPSDPSAGNTGCISPTTEYSLEVDTTGTEQRNGYTPPDCQPLSPDYPCYTHKSMAEMLDGGSVGWTYYAPPDGAGNIWTAPNALTSTCTSRPTPNGSCDLLEWNSHVVVSSYDRSILTDIQNCTLNQGSWVIPDGLWSDHSGNFSRDGGPSWVAAIVNAVGQSGSQGCDNNPHGYWDDTVILVTWDDWGGFYDHVAPFSNGYANTPQQNGNNIASSYVYGFRVPLLVVSTYAKPQHISGACGVYGTPPCPSNNYQTGLVHDFGSILGYIEYVFCNSNCEINPDYHDADYYAPDGSFECSVCAYPLADFFGTTPIPFTYIQGAKYPPSCFTQDANSPTCFGSGYPSDPDDDEIDAD